MFLRPEMLAYSRRHIMAAYPDGIYEVKVLLKSRLEVGSREKIGRDFESAAPMCFKTKYFLANQGQNFQRPLPTNH